VLLLAGQVAGAEGDTPDFARNVRPIFASRCLACHGPKKQTSGLRLDEGPAALAGGDSGLAIVPGKASASPLIERVSSMDPSLRMPPEGEPLAADEIDVLRRWIDEGAKWPGVDLAAPKALHWSLRPVVRRDPPPHSRISSPIDRFIAAKLAEQGLLHSPEADRRTLIRRLSLDLVGIAPAPEEVDAFVANPDPLAYEKLVDRLLASPRHGERWAQHWLDAVRFAESDGFETNKPRANAWPYRDYVIASLNADKPYDRFVLEQLAGDVVGADAATGFLVGGANDVVTSPDPVLTAQQRADVLHDMVSTTASTFLGLTAGCARCHNHKFDPIPQADYYSLKATLEGVAHGERPLPEQPDSSRPERLAELRRRAAQLDAELLQFEPLAAAAADAAQSLSGSADDPQKNLRPAVHPRLNIDRFLPITARRLRMTVHKTNNLEPCIDELEVYSADEPRRNVALAETGTKAAASSVYPNSTIHRLEHINDARLGNGRSWISNEPGGGWVELEFPEVVRIDAVRWGRDREEKYADRLAIEYTLAVADDAGNWTTVATHRDREPFVAGKKFDPTAAIDRLPVQNQERAKVAAAERSRLETEINELARPQMLYAGVFTASPVNTHRFHRGDPMQPREKIEAGGLRAITIDFSPAGRVTNTDSSSLTEDQRRRLSLARWIVDPANPLTSRVIVNRLWQHHFGEGIVATSSDFGTAGARPTHPELLDWLAAELVEHNWSLRHIHRLIVLSATYRQASADRPEAAAIDAGSRLLWRYPPRRLEAEQIRDAILAASGKLDLTMGGPGFLPFEPNDNYVRVYNPKRSHGPEDFRRMIYMTRIRMQQEPTFGAFDCPDGGQIAPRRSQSITPLQALNLLNSAFVNEQAEFFAKRIEREAGADAGDQVRRAFQIALQRQPATEEVAAGEQVIREHGGAILCRALFNCNEFVYLP
jgi:hypothetical protein